MVPIGVARRKTGTVTGAKKLFTAGSNEHYLSFKYEDELFCQRVPMQLARPSARLKLKKIDAERFLDPPPYPGDGVAYSGKVQS